MAPASGFNIGFECSYLRFQLYMGRMDKIAEDHLVGGSVGLVTQSQTS